MEIKILVVDDEPQLEYLFQQKFRRNLRKKEFELSFVLSAVEALEALQSSKDINIVLSDINMPEMDGLSFIAQLDEINPDIKTVMVSAYGDMKNIRTAMNHGAFDFITKPIDFTDLEATIRKAIKEVEARKQATIAQVQLKKTKEELDAANELDELKTRLFANITHEFRTPLTVIIGMIDKLVSAPDQWLTKGADMIRRNGHNLLRLVNQLLDLSKLEAGKLPLHLVQADVIEYLHYLVESFHSFAEIKDIRLHFLADEEALMMDYDPDNLLKIVSNLLSNAIKFTDKGGDVYMSVRSEGILLPNTDKPALLIKVKDTGIGIPEDKLPYIFDRFYQAKPNSNEQSKPLNWASPAEGTGIGLSLTRELVKLMGGMIKVNSTLGKGTTFTVYLPIQREAQIVDRMEKNRFQEKMYEFTHPSEKETAAINISFAPNEARPTALIVEDNADISKYLAACLEGDYQLEMAANGQEGIDRALSMAPDIIISDVMMPQKDGYELCYTLKNDIRTSHIPIVLLTAKADVESRLIGLRQGADAYLAKPFNEEELQIRMAHLLEIRRNLRQKYSGQSQLTDAPPEVADSDTPLEDEFIRRVRTIIEEHMDDYELDVSKLCKKLGISRTPLHNKLKALTGKSTTEFIRYIRLTKAGEMLLATTLNISEIAYDTGFSNPNYFTKMFGLLFGMSPSEYRETKGGSRLLNF